MKNIYDIAFENKAKEVHGSKYDYTKSVISPGVQKVCITCPSHGDFWQSRFDHIKGYGCSKCQRAWGGKGVVYIMCTPEGHNKIGICKNGKEQARRNRILLSQRRYAPLQLSDIQVVASYSFEDGSYMSAHTYEGKAHRHFKLRHKQFSEKFDGSCEFFTVPVSEICSYLEQQGGKLVTIKQSNQE